MLFDAQADTGFLLIIDYAETRPDGLAALMGELAKHATREGPPIRVLLLARSDGDWWQEIARSNDAIGVVERPAVPMETTGSVSIDRRAFFDACAKAFAARLRLEEIGVVEAAAPPDLTPDLFDRPLTLAMAAFLAVIGRPANAGGLFDALLAEEDKNWARAAGAAPAVEARALRKASIRNAAAQATLLQGAPGETLVRLRQADPLLAGEKPAEARAAGAALGLLYPGADGAAAPLEPDLLGEAMLARVCRDAHGRALLRAALADALARADAEGVRRALTVAIRMSWHPEAATRDAAAALLEDWEAALVPKLDESALAVLDDAIPWATTALRPLALAMAQARLDAHRMATVGASETADAEQARRWDVLGVRLSHLGRREEALAAMETAVALYEILAARNPDAFNPDLAGSLSNLGVLLSDLGRREEALAATDRAVVLYETLAAHNPDAFNPELAGSLSNLGTRLSSLGRRDEALAAEERAVAIRVTLALRNPDAFNPDLAASLSNLGVLLSDLGRREEALAATQRAVAIRETLAARNPDAFNPDLAGSLSNLGIRLSNLGRLDEALAAEEQAVAIRERLAARNPDAFNPDLARSLSNLGVKLSNVGRRDQAIGAYERAALILRRIRVAHGGVHRALHDLNLEALRRALTASGLDEAAIAAWLNERGLD
jgi:tetratricopeptide (TPR) repeat protein